MTAMGPATRLFSNSAWGRKRFYKNTSVYQQGNGFGVRLDFRVLRTPLRKLFIVPREQLAVGVAQEWAAQNDVIVPSKMHLTSLCNTVIDDVYDKKLNVNSLKQYLLSDTLCYYASEPEELVKLQEDHWSPVVNWFNKRFSANIQPSNRLFGNRNELNNSDIILSVTNKWSNVGLQQLMELTGSFILTMALFMNRLTVSQASWLARLETEYQINQWGRVEWHHEVDQTQLNSALSASLLFTKLTTNC